MMQETKVNREVAATTQPESQAQLAREAMPVSPRSNIFGRVASMAAMTMALATSEMPAQASTNGPSSPAPAVEPAVPKAIPVTVAPAVMTDKTNITQLVDRKFCMDDYGNVLIARRTQVRQIGQEVQGLPSNGEALRAICEGVEHLKSLNGGEIPAGQDVKLRIKAENGEDTISRSFTINPARLSTIADLSPAALDTAMADPMNRKAIEAIRNEVNLHVVRSGTDTLTMTFIGKEPGQTVALSVELAPRQ